MVIVNLSALIIKTFISHYCFIRNQCKIGIMKSWQAILTLLFLMIGVVAGLVYGWQINPVIYIDSGIESLRTDYQTDLILMTADVYAADLDLETAIQKISQIRSNDIQGLLAASLEYARQMNFSSQDIEKLDQLKDAVDQFVPEGTNQP